MAFDPPAGDREEVTILRVLPMVTESGTLVHRLPPRDSITRLTPNDVFYDLVSFQRDQVPWHFVSASIHLVPEQD